MVESGDLSPLPPSQVCNYKSGKLEIGSVCKMVDRTDPAWLLATESISGSDANRKSLV